MGMLKVLFWATLVLGLSSVISATVLHVPSQYPTIQAGINAATEGDTVLVADGTYTGDGNRDLDFGGVNMVVMSEQGPEVTIIDCEGSQEDNHRGFYFHSEEDSRSVVQGFTITNGVDGFGGGILCDYSSWPTIADNIIRGNIGGGIACWASRSIIRRNVITGNMWLNYFGGGVYMWQCDDLSLEHNLIIGNSAARGGGIYTGHSSITMEGTTISGNIASQAGGGIYVDWQSALTVSNSIVWGDTAPVGPEIHVEEWGMTSVTYSDVEGGWQGEGNIDCSPRFVTGPLGGYYLAQHAAGQRPQSACVDAGDPDSPLPDGTTRTDGVPDSLVVDMGYHYPIGEGVHVGLMHEQAFVAPTSRLGQNYPNPFRSSTTIAYSLPASSSIRLAIYDIRGALVRELVSGSISSGRHRAVWGGRDGWGHKVASGVYFCRLEAGERDETRRMVLLR